MPGPALGRTCTQTPLRRGLSYPMSHPFTDYVAGFQDLLIRGQALTADMAVAQALPVPVGDAPVCLLFSPHPDDEAISGALAWRLRRQYGWRVVNVAVTLGSNKERRDRRWAELTACCAQLGFELISASGEAHRGLERTRVDTASEDPDHWAACVACIRGLLRQYRPRVVVCPHALDGHDVHIGTYALVREAIVQLSPDWKLDLLLSEYWNTQMDPRLMVALDHRDVAALIAALCQHVGEVARNPYHLTLVPWFMDSVRRGAERVGKAGTAAPEFVFAALYGWLRWSGGTFAPMPARVLDLDAAIDPFAG